MELQKDVIETLSWELEGSGELKIILKNSQLESVRLCENGEDKASCISSLNYKHLKNLSIVLSEMVAHVEKNTGRTELLNENQTKS